MVLELHIKQFDNTYTITHCYVPKENKGVYFQFNSQKHTLAFYDIHLHDFVILENVRIFRIYKATQNY